MPDQPISLVWFRQDLRLSDNPALQAAVARGSILPIYILDEDNAGSWAAGAASKVWLHHSLQSLNRSLDGKLRLFRGDAESILDDLTTHLSIEAVFWNRCYEPWRIGRDRKIKRLLVDKGLRVESFNASLLWEPWEINKADGTAYKVFTPFFQKGCLAAPPPREPVSDPTPLNYAKLGPLTSLDINALNLLPAQSWHENLASHWRIGETAALDRLEAFCSDALSHYQKGRDFPALQSTSLLSSHLHFGEISPNQAWYRIEREAVRIQSSDAFHFLRELGWREFSYHLLYHFPELPDQNFNAKFDRFEWLTNAPFLESWQQGKTGFPIVDAGMRELWQTGYMHNRVRMIVASFLVKNMLIDWREGCRWFWDCLVDADLASNSASWQWCSGSGADAAPYFRIFNPVLQSKKFDPEGKYIARYVPELANLPTRLRHEPWLDEEAIKKFNYPAPILDLKTTRERALARYKSLPRRLPFP